MQTNPIPPCPAILIERICAPIRDYGLPVLTAVTLVGIDPDLWPALCPRGSALAFAVRKAEAQFMHTLLKLLFGPSIPGQRVNKAQIRAILERRFPHEWGRLKGGRPATPNPDFAQEDFDSQQSAKPFEWPVVEEDAPASTETPLDDDDPLPVKAARSKNSAGRRLTCPHRAPRLITQRRPRRGRLAAAARQTLNSTLYRQ